ncbi:hypothetical protein [Micromonospora chaiyaphumensis]|uniref:Uncharacterized protein n=1 Tax=Micromonospora chaiyaphumensis TaxID=307119 RepID=A0A1C4VN02_9ACTN|nr:hypothetical protein GA0070214_102555 [Micromonospora chaiyaphumensis]
MSSADAATAEAIEPATVEAVGQLLDAAGIRRVICVDDWYATAVEVEPIIGGLVAGALPASEVLDVWRESQEALPATDDIEVITEELREAWDSFDEAIKQRMHLLLEADHTAEDGSTEPQDAPALDELRDIIPVQYLTLRLSDWRRESSSLLKDGIPTLLLLDRNFDRESLGPDAGERELVRLYREAPETWRFGLLTHTVADADGEVELWRDLKSRYGEEATRLIVIAKNRLIGRPSEFPSILKVALLNATLKRLSAEIRSAVHSTWESAFQQLEKLDPYALQRALSGRRASEGTWAPDTLLRVAVALCEDKIRVALHNSERVHQDGGLLMRINEISLPVEAEIGVSPGDDIIRVQRLEYLDESSLEARPTLPLEAGDIFKVLRDSDQDPTDAKLAEFVVVVGQPCDLMVRSDGRRNADRLVAVAPIQLEGFSRKRPREGHVGYGDEHWFSIPYLDVERTKIGKVRLNRVFHLPAHVLDLSVVSGDGTATWVKGRPAPTALVPSWQERWKHLDAWVHDLLTEHRPLLEAVSDPLARTSLLKALLGIAHIDLISVNLDFSKYELRFGLSRVARLRDPYRGALVLRAAQREMRQAFDSWLIDSV